MQTVDIILSQFPKTALIPMTVAGSCIGLAKQTCYNMVHAGTFPIPVRKLGSKSMVALRDLIAYLDEGPTAFEKKEEEKAPKRRPGRPTNAEIAQRMGKA